MGRSDQDGSKMIKGSMLLLEEECEDDSASEFSNSIHSYWSGE